jgi:hypothetical protein
VVRSKRQIYLVNTSPFYGVVLGPTFNKLALFLAGSEGKTDTLLDKALRVATDESSAAWSRLDAGYVTMLIATAR